MSFRKRSAVLSSATSAQSPAQRVEKQLAPGLRPSPLDGRLTTSTGTASLDTLLAGHAGLPLGTSLLIEEQGTTDFSGVILRYYGAEGLVQGHQVHVLGFGDTWRHELPALAARQEASDIAKSQAPPDEKMKIAWRYESLGNRNASSLPIRDKDGAATAIFCHNFDLTKRLAPAAIKGSLLATPASSPLSFRSEAFGNQSPLRQFLKNVQTKIAGSPPSTIHRVVVPSLLSPTLYPSGICHPTEILQFFHSLRALLRQYSSQLSAMITFPVSLHPRSNGLTRWMELLSDGVLELIPLPPDNKAAAPSASSKSATKDADRSQGLLRVHSLPIYHEKGGGGAEGNHFREDLSFSLSSSKGLVIKPYSLPPLEDDDNKEKSPASTVKDGIEF